MAALVTELIVDAADPWRVARFWAAVLDYRISEDSTADVVELSGPPERGPRLVFVKVPEPKTLKNRVHLDVNPIGCDQEAELRRLRDLGASEVSVGQASDVPWIVLADPEGNEFCLLRRQLDAPSESPA